MATVRASLSLSSSDVLSSALALSVVSSITCDSGSLIKAKVKGTAADSDDMIVYLANEKNDRAYLYIKNLEPELENYIYVRIETLASAVTSTFAKVGGGEFAFIPLDPAATAAVFATKVDSIIEYGVFGNDNSGVSLGGSGTGA
jgi:hypothetical protein